MIKFNRVRLLPIVAAFLFGMLGTAAFAGQPQTVSSGGLNSDGLCFWEYSDGVVIPEEGLELEGYLLTMTVDGIETEIRAGMYSGVVTITATEQLDVRQSVGGQAAYRTGLYIDQGKIATAKSASSSLTEGTFAATRSYLTDSVSRSGGFSFFVINSSSYSLSSAKLIADSDSDGRGASDYTGFGSAVSVFDSSIVNIENSYIETSGVAKAAVFVDSADVLVQNSTLVSNGGAIYADYESSSSPLCAVSPMWSLGISGSARTVSAVGTFSTATFVDSTISSADWSAISADAGSSMVLTAINCDIEVGAAGAAVSVISSDGNTRAELYGTRVAAGKFLAILSGADMTVGSYVGGEELEISRQTADSFVSKVSSSKLAANKRVSSELCSDGFGFLLTGESFVYYNTLALQSGTTVETENAVFLIQRASAEISIDGAELYSSSGVLLEMIDSERDIIGIGDDGTLGASFVESDGWSSSWGTAAVGSKQRTTVSITGTALVGDFYNATGYAQYTDSEGSAEMCGAMSLSVKLGAGASLEGVITAAEYSHVEKEITYRQSSYDTQTAAEAALALGVVKCRSYSNGKNSVAVTLVDGAVWTVTDACILSELTIDSASKLTSPDFTQLLMYVDGEPTAIEPGSYYGEIELKILWQVSYSGEYTLPAGWQLPAGRLLTVTVDGGEVEVESGRTYFGNDITMTVTQRLDSMASLSAQLGEFPYRTGIFVCENVIDEERSVLSAYAKAELSGTLLSRCAATSETAGYSFAIIKDSVYKLSDVELVSNSTADGSEGCDFVGYGAALAVFGTECEVTVQNSHIKASGVAKSALFVDDGAQIVVKGSTLVSTGGSIYNMYLSTDDMSLQVSPEWTLGIAGSARTVSVFGDGTQASFVDCSIIAADWGALTGSGKGIELCAVNCYVEVAGSGYGVYLCGAEGNFSGSRFDADTCAAMLEGGSLSLRSYTGGKAVGTAEVSSSVVAPGKTVSSTVSSENFGFVIISGENSIELCAGTAVTTDDAVFLIKNAAAQISIDSAALNSGTGVLVQMMDDDGDGVGTTYNSKLGAHVFNAGFSEADGWSGDWGTAHDACDGSVEVVITNAELEGDFYNSGGYTGGARALFVKLGVGASLEGVISAGEYQHTSKSFTYRYSSYSYADAYAAASKLGHVVNRSYYNGSNDVIVELTDGAAWTVTGECRLTQLTIGRGCDVTLEGDLFCTVNGAETTLSAGESYTGYIVFAEREIAQIASDPTQVVLKNGETLEVSEECALTYLYIGKGCSVKLGKGFYAIVNGTRTSLAEGCEYSGIILFVQKSYLDVPVSYWGFGAIETATYLGLFSGTGGGCFSPTAQMTRGMAATVLWNYAGKPSAKISDTPFADVASGAYYAQAVAWAYKHGVVQGVSKTRFDPASTITREQLVAIMYNYAKATGMSVSATTSLSKYSDSGKISSYAVAPMSWSVASGLITGTSAKTLSPKATATRAEAATILMRFALMAGG